MERDFKDWGGNILALVAVVLVNAIATGLPLGGVTTGEVSARYESTFTPAGYAFAIWGLIYVALFAFVLYQAGSGNRNDEQLARISRPWQLSCLFNVVWIFFWHYDFLLLSMLAMLGLLLSLVTIYRELGIAVTPAPLGRKLFVHVPFSIYTGWICVATIANLSAVQVGTGWESLIFDAETWTLLKLGVAGAIGATLICRRRDIAATLVVAWAAWAISVKQAGVPAVAGAAQTLTYIALLLVAFEIVRLTANRGDT
ncbi:MAG: tryptophan-rich sensory protein [Gammaproteobacteria bacterium]|nr:tryptophan-rich sensory protein [Gammaproteobacteria bacterium]NND55391.1 tryptophan-rich sensory protein [Gammaproteobacteria bacterium]